jgi:peptide chain release factor
VVQQYALQLKEWALKNELAYQIQNKKEGKYKETAISIMIQLHGEFCNTEFLKWIGIIKWVGESPFRKHCKRKNWFIQVSLKAPSEYLRFNVKDLQYESFRSSGPGGQHANKVSSGIRVKHLLTGLEAIATERRSQHQNKQLAIARIKQKFEVFIHERNMSLGKDVWSDHLQIERGNPVKVFKGPKFKLHV